MKYDYIVIGGGLGGLVSAIILAKEKKKVLVLEQHTKPGGYLHSFYRKKHRFETGFHFAPALSEEQILTMYWKYLGVYEKLDLVPYNKDHFHSLVFPDKTYNMPSGLDNLKEKLINDFPQEADAVCAYIEKMKQIRSYFIYFNRSHQGNLTEEHKTFEISVGDYLDLIGASSRLKAVILAHSFLYGVPPSRTPLGTHGVFFNALYSSVYDIKGGGDGLSAALVESLRENGGDIHYKKEVCLIDVKDKVIKGVVTTDESYYEADQVVCDINPQSALELFSEKVFRKAYTGRIGDMENTLSHFGLYCTVDNKDLGKIDYDVLYFPSYDIDSIYRMPVSSGPDDFFLYATFPTSRIGTSQGQHIMETVSVDSWDNYTAWENSKFGKRPEEYKAFKEQTARRVLEKACRLFPGVEGNLGITEASTPLTNYHYTKSPKGSIYGIEHNMSQMRAPIRARTKLPGFYFTGQSLIFPGIVGVTITGFVTCADILGQKYLFDRIDGKISP